MPRATSCVVRLAYDFMELETLTYIWKAVLLGIHAGFSPGPVSTMIITQSLLHGRRAGMKIATVPFLTDIPIITIIIPALYYLTFGLNNVIALISIVGACLLCYLAYESLSVTTAQFQQNNAPSLSLFRAIGINLFNPNLYIYWITICGPLSISAFATGGFATMFLFIGVYFASITSVKLGMALILGSVRHSLNWNIIIWINRLLGIVLLFIAASFLWQGYKVLFMP
jgi:threonine/homoserine/homoserine lactone efflux protein